MVERESFRIQHRDGTLTILGARNQSFSALESPFRSISESEIESKIKQTPLPFKDKVGAIVGWGGFSVAARLENSSSADSSGEVVVLKPLLAKDSLNAVKELDSNWKEEQVINEEFAPFTIPQHLIIVNGFDGKPMALKAAREVEGTTFKDSSLLAVLSNLSVLEQYTKFCQKVLKVFISEGKLVDTSGHITENKLKQLWIGMIPFYSDNLMVEYGSSKLVFVDCDIKPAIHFFHKANWPQRVGMLMRAGIIGTTAVAAEAFVLGHKLRSQFLEEDYTRKNVDQIRSNEEYQNFIGGLKEIFQTLNSAGVNYRVVGSLGMAGSIQSFGGEFYLTPKRINRTERDVDIIVLDHDSEKNEKIRRDLVRRSKEIKGYPYPDIVLPKPIEVYEPAEKKEYLHEGVLPFGISRPAIDGNGNFYLVYEDLTCPINSHILQPVYVHYEGTRFATVSPEVQAGFYLTRGGNFKPKDLKKIEILFNYTKPHIPVVFRDFARAIRDNYSELYHNFLIREWFSYWTGGFISGGQITRFIGSNLCRQGDSNPQFPG